MYMCICVQDRLRRMTSSIQYWHYQENPYYKSSTSTSYQNIWEKMFTKTFQRFAVLFSIFCFFYKSKWSLMSFVTVICQKWFDHWNSILSVSSASQRRVYTSLLTTTTRTSLPDALWTYAACNCRQNSPSGLGIVSQQAWLFICWCWQLQADVPW